MPRCVDCEANVPRTINPDTQTVERCGVCGRSCDMYAEFGSVQTAIDVLLLQRRAWVHLLFNESVNIPRNVVPALCGCFLEAFVAHTLYAVHHVAREQRWCSDDPAADITGAVTSVACSHKAATERAPTLQLVTMLQSSSTMSSTQYRAALPSLLLHSCAEYVLLVMIAVMLGQTIPQRVDRYEALLLRWVRVVSLATSVKTCYLLFLIWRLPPSLLLLVDALVLLSVARGLLALFPHKPWLYSAPALLVFCAARWCYRQQTDWNTQVMR